MLYEFRFDIIEFITLVVCITLIIISIIICFTITKLYSIKKRNDRCVIDNAKTSPNERE